MSKEKAAAAVEPEVLPSDMEEVMVLISKKKKEKEKLQKLVDKAAEEAEKKMLRIKAKREAYLLSLKEEEAEVKKETERQLGNVKDLHANITQQIQSLIRHMGKLNNAD